MTPARAMTIRARIVDHLEPMGGITAIACYMAGLELGVTLATAQPATAVELSEAFAESREPNAWWVAAGLQAMADAVSE